MRVSLNQIRYYQQKYEWSDDPAPDGVDAWVEKIGAQLGAVEEIIPFGERFDGVLIAKIVACEDHPNADRLHVCKIDDGGKAENVERDADGLVQVVCGAPNVREGLLVAWLPPGATVPESRAKDPFVLEARPLRGVVSNGMLASPRELTIGDNHDGILEVTLDADEKIAPGTSFAEAFHLTGDTVIDIENKMFTHRPDCFGMIGVAREIAGIQDQAFTSPAWYQPTPDFPDIEADELKLTVRNELPDLVPRFTAIALRDVAVHDSPLWLQLDLVRAGLRPINNIVDYTNYYMLLTGQPLHAYDYDKVCAQDGADHATIVVRKPHEGEKIALLNGKTIAPRAGAIMIATAEKPIGLGGVMGGVDTEVDARTRNIIIECANFDMYAIRRTSMAHGLFTDAVTRFNKGQSPLQNLAVLAKIVDEIRRFANGKVASQVIDDNQVSAAALERGALHAPVTVTQEFINVRLGLELSAEGMAALLRNVEFNVAIKGETLTVAAPFWRTDIELPEDIVEEIGRLYGYDHLALNLPQRDLTPTPKNPGFETKAKIRATLQKAGANEVLTYSFVHGNLLDKVGQNPDDAWQLGNALSPDLQYYRLSLLPSLLDKVHANVKAGYDEFALFELGKAHKVSLVDAAGQPLELENLALVYAAHKNDKTGAAYYEARKFLIALADTFGLSLTFTPLEPSDGDDPQTAPFQPGRAALVGIKGSGQSLGVVGEFRVAVRRALKLPDKSAGFEIGYGPFTQRKRSAYTMLPRFPKLEQDICLKVAQDAPYEQVFDLVWNSLQNQAPDTLLCDLSPVDIYQRSDDPAHKQITLRLSAASYERTLTDAEVSKMLDHAAAVARNALHAERI